MAHAERRRPGGPGPPQEVAYDPPLTRGLLEEFERFRHEVALPAEGRLVHEIDCGPALDTLC